MIKETIKAIKNIFIPPIEYRNFEDDIECAIDENIVDCKEMDKETPYTGVPAPAYLKDDPWFGSAPISDANRDYMEQETFIKQQEHQETHSVESEDIHQKMYEIATSNWNTVDETKQSMGGSENIQNWNSGTGMGQYR